MDWLLNLDRHLFYIINYQFSNPFFDAIMPLLRNKFFWSPIYIFIVSFLIINKRKKSIIYLLFIFLTILFSDQICSSMIKPLFHRLRPCNNPEFSSQAALLVHCGSGFSFPSSHASNHFALSVFLIKIFPKSLWLAPVLFLWATLVAYAQVYVGVHYPLDVLVGGLLGITIGFLLALTCKEIIKKLKWA